MGLSLVTCSLVPVIVVSVGCFSIQSSNSPPLPSPQQILHLLQYPRVLVCVQVLLLSAVLSIWQEIGLVVVWVAVLEV